MVTKKDKYLAAAQKFLERGQLDKALAEFAKVVQEDPKDTRTWLKMAELHAKRGAADQATEIYLKTGELYTEQGFFQKAVAVYKNVVKLSPSYVQGHFKLADVYRRLGLVSDAIQQYELAAFAYQKIGKSAEALAALREIVEVNPENVISRIKLAESASQAGATDEAIREFSLAADQLKAQGRSDEYVRVAERLLFHQPDNVEVARELAETYVSKNNPRLALAKLQACLKVEPRDPQNVSLLARAFEQLDVPKAVSVWRELAQIHQDSGRFTERDVAIRKALLLDPRDGDAQEMARQYGISVGMTPAPPPLPGSSLSSLRAPPSASGGYSGMTPASPLPTGVRRAGAGDSSVRVASPPASAPDISRIMAESDVFVKYGLLDRAVDHLRRAFEIQPDYLPAREKLAAVLTQLGRRTEAAAELEYMAEHLARTDRAQAMKLAERARVLDPAAARAGALLEAGDGFDSLGTPAPSRRPGESLSAPMFAPSRPPPSPPRHPTLQRPPEPAARSHAFARAGVPGFDDAATPEVAMNDLPDDLADDLSEDLSIDELDIDLEADDDPVADMLTPPPALAAQISARVSGSVSPSRPAAVLPSPVAVKPARVSAAAPAPAPTPEADADLVEELEQVDFFIEQAIPDEARSLLQDLRGRFPGHPLIEKKMAEVDRLDGQGAVPTSIPTSSMSASRSTSKPSSGFSSSHSSSFSSSHSSSHSSPPPLGSPADFMGAVPSEPPARIGHRGFEPDSQPVAVVAGGGKADLSTHGDLGIAYKEMGLLDPAIAEFKLLTEDPKREVFALTMIGECCEAKGSLTDAIIRYKEALNCPQVTPEETIQLYFCLGSTFERLSDRSEALYFYEKVAKRDSKFRDVADKIAALKTAPRTARQA